MTKMFYTGIFLNVDFMGNTFIDFDIIYNIVNSDLLRFMGRGSIFVRLILPTIKTYSILYNIL